MLQQIRDAGIRGADAKPERSAAVGRILVIDDNMDRRERTVDFLENQGFHARGVSAHGDLTGMVRHGRWNLVIVWIEEPYAGGLEQVRLVRSVSLVPIVVTGTLCAINRIVVLELGADSYVAASAEPQELWAVGRAILRRDEIGGRSAFADDERGGFRFSGWELNRSDRLLKSPSGKVVRLTRATYSLLLALLEAPGRILSRAHLLRATRRHDDVFDRSVDIQIMRLREALRRGAPDQCLIKTERGVGYMLDCEVAPYH